jgi:hypothetical protein
MSNTIMFIASSRIALVDDFPRHALTADLLNVIEQPLAKGPIVLGFVSN